MSKSVTVFLRGVSQIDPPVLLPPPKRLLAGLLADFGLASEEDPNNPAAPPDALNLDFSPVRRSGVVGTPPVNTTELAVEALRIRALAPGAKPSSIARELRLTAGDMRELLAPSLAASLSERPSGPVVGLLLEKTLPILLDDCVEVLEDAGREGATAGGATAQERVALGTARREPSPKPRSRLLEPPSMLFAGARPLGWAEEGSGFVADRPNILRLFDDRLRKECKAFDGADRLADC